MLLDKFLPKYTYNEYHAIQVSCSKEQAYAAARNLDFSESKTIKLLFAMRGLPVGDMTLDGFCRNVNFTLIEEVLNEEFIIGFWANTGIEKILDREQFAVDNESRRLKVVWNFKVDQMEKGLMVVSTETRIYCAAMITKLFFSLYWMLIKPFSGLIRKKMLNIIKQSAENPRAAAIPTG